MNNENLVADISTLYGTAELCRNRANELAFGAKNKEAIERIARIKIWLENKPIHARSDELRRYCNQLIHILRDSGVNEADIERVFFQGELWSEDDYLLRQGVPGSSSVYRSPRGAGGRDKRTMPSNDDTGTPSFNPVSGRKKRTHRNYAETWRTLWDDDSSGYRANAVRALEDREDHIASSKEIMIKMSKKEWFQIGISSGWIKDASKLEPGGEDLEDIFGNPDNEEDSKGREAPFSPSSAEFTEDVIGWVNDVLPDEIANDISNYVEEKLSEHKESAAPHILMDEINLGIHGAIKAICKQEHDLFDCDEALDASPVGDKFERRFMPTSVTLSAFHYALSLFEDMISEAEDRDSVS